MTPEQLVQILVALNAAGGLGILLQMWQHRQERSGSREDAHDARQQQRIDELEQAQKERDTARDAEIKELRGAVEECHKNHAFSLAEVAGLKAENQGLQRQMNALNEEMERRRSFDGPPPGREERRSPDRR